jgi:hypothetical protein
MTRSWVSMNDRFSIWVSIPAKAKFFNQRSRMFVSVDYPLYPGAKVGAQARRVGQAVGWARANGAKYGGNPGRIALMDHSAGCHLSALATLSELPRTENYTTKSTKRSGHNRCF